MIYILENFSVQHPDGTHSYRFLAEEQFTIESETAMEYLIKVPKADSIWDGIVHVPRVLEGETYEKVKGR